MGLHISVPVKSLSLFILVLIFSIVACTSSKKSSSEDGENAKIEKSDSLDLNNPEMQEENLAPGTARIVVKEFNISEQENGHVSMQAVLQEVLGYGPATPPMSPGNRIAINATEYFSNTDTKAGYYSGRDSLICLVGKQGDSPASKSEGGSSWKLMNIYSQ